MSDPKGHAAPRDTRWWMNSAVVRLAFGQETLMAGAENGKATRSSEPDPNDPSQREFGDFELREVIGRGGMGVIYRAFQRSLDRDVALKLLSGGIWAAPEFVATLRREARYAALLQHPNIVAVYEIGDFDGQVYYAMQLVEGRSLAEHLQQHGPLPPRDAATLLRTVAEAVDYAHRQGMLHLDLKSGNVILGDDRVPRITDFGLARRLGADGLLDNERVSGTPGYMAPEQVQVHGNKLSAATDVWGLGAILYEALTGHPPFEGDTPQAVVGLVHEGTVRTPRRYNDGLPRDLEAICLRCLHKDPAQRYRSARALADDLGRFIEGREVRARPLNVAQHARQWMRREPRMAVVSAMAFAALLAGILIAAREWQRAETHSRDASLNLWAQREESAWRQFEDSRGYAALSSLAANLREQEAIGATGEARQERLRLGVARSRMPVLLGVFDAGAAVHVAALSPDGKWVALGLDPLTVALYERSTGKLRWRTRLKQHRPSWDGQMRRLAFTPDGAHLVVSEHWTMGQMRPAGYRTYRLAVANGHQTPVPGGSSTIGESWSDDGQHVLLQAEDGRVSLHAGDGTALAESRIPTRSHPYRPSWLLPAGIPFIAYRPSLERVDVLDGRNLALRHRIDIGRPGDGFIAWTSTPDGRWLALGTQQGRVLLVDTRTGRQQLLLADAGGEVTWLSTSAGGRRLAVSTRQGELSLWSLPTGTPIGRAVLRREVWGHQVECDEAGDHCLVLAMHWDRVAMWAIDSIEGQGGQVVRVAPEITHHSFIPRFASSFALASGLLVTGSQDGVVRLWRLPPSPQRAAMAAPRREWPLTFDGRRLVEVDGLRLRLVDAETQRPASSWVTFARPIGFASLTPDGHGLVVTSGDLVHVLQLPQFAPKYPPFALGGTPIDLLISGDSRVLVARWLPADPSVPEYSRVQAFDLTRGHPIGPAGDMPMSSARLSHDGQSVLVIDATASRMYGIRDLRRPHLVFPPVSEDSDVVAAEFDETRREVVQATEKNYGGLRSALERWSVEDGRLLQALPLNASIDSLIVEPASGAIAISGRPGGTARTDLSIIIRRDAKRIPVALAGEGHLARAQAVSPDGSILAQAMFNGVMLIDAAKGSALGPPLQASLPANDVVVQLAFAPNGQAVLARTALGRWLLWSLAPDRRATRVIEEEAALLAPPPSTSFVAPSQALRNSWWVPTDTPTSPPKGRAPAWSCLTASIPPRLAKTPPYLLDLGPHYTLPLLDRLDIATSYLIRNQAMGNPCGIPIGLERLAGRDYDIRGLLHLPSQGDAPLSITVPTGRFTSVHVLSGIGAPPTDFIPVQPSARLDFEYRDGTVASATWATRLETNGRDVAPPDARVVLAWRGPTPRNEVGPAMESRLYSARVDNPHPERELVGLKLHAATSALYDQRVLIAALTLDPYVAP